MKKLIPALILLLVSAMVLSTSSYAWFSMNRTVSATGMTLTSTAPANLLIGDKDAVKDTAEDWNSTVAAAEIYTGKLYPASTKTGLEFFAIQDGQILSSGVGGVVSGSVNATTKFNSSIDNNDVVKAMVGSTSGYWAEYVLKFKTTGESPLEVYLDNISFADDIFYTRVASPIKAEISSYYERTGSAPNYVYTHTADTDIDAGKTYYTAASIYKSVASPIEANMASYYEESGNVYTLTADTTPTVGKTYYTISTIESCVRVGLYQDLNNNGTFEDGEVIGIYAVDNGTTVNPVEDLNGDSTAILYTTSDVKKLLTTDTIKKATVFTVAANQVVKTITVRVWIEGQNPNCINSIAGQDFSIGLTFKTATTNS